MAKKKNFDEEESWIKQYWRPLLSYQYIAVCLFDFIFLPTMTMGLSWLTGNPYVQWDPITLKESGFYHLSMSAIIGAAAWTRGQEKIKRMFMGEEIVEETTTTTQTPTGN